MSQSQASNKVKLAIIGLLVLGIVTVVSSAFFLSSFFVMVGFCLVFWSSLLLYLIPSRNESLLLFDAMAQPISANMELLIKKNNLNKKGVYLPYNIHSNQPFSSEQTIHTAPGSTIVFLPEKTVSTNITGRNLIIETRGGLYITPPGEGLCKAIERLTGQSLKKMGLEEYADFINRAFRQLKLAQSVEVQIKENVVTVDITKSHLTGVCHETNEYPHTHTQVGCLLSSTLASALTKVSGKPVIIEKEILNLTLGNSKIQMRLLPSL